MVPVGKVNQTLRNIRADNPGWTIVAGVSADGKVAGVLVCKGADTGQEVAVSYSLGQVFTSSRIMELVYQVLEGTSPSEAEQVMKRLHDLF